MHIAIQFSSSSSSSYAAFQYCGEPVIYCVCLFVCFFLLSLCLRSPLLECHSDRRFRLPFPVYNTRADKLQCTKVNKMRAVFTESDDEKWFNWDYAETQRSHQLITTWVLHFSNSLIRFLKCIQNWFSKTKLRRQYDEMTAMQII